MTKEDFLSKLREEDRAIFGQIYDSLVDLGYEIQPTGSVLEGDQNYDDIDLLVTGALSDKDVLKELFKGASEEACDLVLCMIGVNLSKVHPGKSAQAHDHPDFDKTRSKLFGKKLESVLGLEDFEIKNIQYDDSSHSYASTEVDSRLKFDVINTKLYTKPDTSFEITKFDISINKKKNMDIITEYKFTDKDKE